MLDKRKIWITFGIIAVIIIALLFRGDKKENKQEVREVETVLSMIDSYRGYIRIVSTEELEFYKYFVERDLPEPVTEEELLSLTKDYANRVNAAFYLGNRWGLCEPYSFEALKLRMEQENTERKIKLEQGEVVYGLEEFTLDIYFQYVMDNLQSSLQGQLEADADKEILEMAEQYYTEHSEDFVYRKEVVYDQFLNGKKETLTADVDMLSVLGKTDTALADFLQMADASEIYEDVIEEGERRVVLKEITYSEEGYENNAEMALYRLVRDELYDSVIDMVAKNNPVQFETN